ncbi:MAG: hypothetical protein GF347_05450 [Candidatus Moranbacteria bacterium]|nr:hypothetical protein [Candidatus Moranbacteria bacterium]
MENFFNENGKSEILEKYKIPNLILAHLGHFDILKLNEDLIKKITENYKNIYFDTSSKSIKHIKRCIELIGSKHIILGSDALINKTFSSMMFVYIAVKKARIKESKEQALINILGNNYQKIISHHEKNSKNFKSNQKK